jgi:hypothetical protein
MAAAGMSRAAIEVLISALIVQVWVKLIGRLFLTFILFGESELAVLRWVWGLDRF